ncbi:hypothetical protein [uncultured Planktosalinus sp.]|uniref:hypothetical protein n=1 Tax=uncultured Planktosalinus sp. TaxID=1810935 RepID=UPI0030DCBBB0
MPFYIYQVVNGNDIGNEVDFFNSEFDFQIQKRKLSKGGNKIYAKRIAQSLVDIISFLCVLDDDDENIKYNYEYFCNRFGIDKIAMEFPNEIFNYELIQNIKLDIKANFDDAMEAHFSSSGKYNGGVDWNKAADDLNRQIDNDDGGTWRIGNDFG